MSRQQRTSVRGSVKTSAGKYAFPLLFDIVADVFFFLKSLIENLLTSPKLDVQMECSQLVMTGAWGSEVTAVGFLLKGNVLWLQTKKKTKNSQTV